MSILSMVELRFLSVKIREDVYRKIRTLAAWEGKPVGEYLSDLVEPIAQARMEKMSAEAAKLSKKKDHGKPPED